MALRECGKCNEMVDEAKAFCPGCGEALVEEERPKTTAFQKLDHTVQFGQTVYNQMLEDMGLKVSEPTSSNEPRVELIKPIAAEPTVPQAFTAPDISAHSPGTSVAQPNKSSDLLKYIVAGLAVLVLLPIALISAILLLLEIWSRLFR